MAARRLILAMLVLLVLSSVAAALIPVGDGGSTSDSSSSTTASTPPAPSGELIKRTISAGNADPQTIKLEVGDQLELTVESKLADQVEIAAFGELEDVDPDFPARFDLLALEPGSFPVRMDESGRVIATIKVAQRGQPKSKASPGSSTRTSTPGASSAT